MADPFKAYRTASGRTIRQLLADYGAEKVAPAFGAALYNEGIGIEQASIGLVPVDTGALRASHYTTQPYYDINMIRVDIGYGGPAAKINPKTGESTDGYALLVHENLEAFHKVGTAKFLEMPFDQAKQGMGARIANFIRGAMHGGVKSMGEPEGI